MAKGEIMPYRVIVPLFLSTLAWGITTHIAHAGMAQTGSTGEDSAAEHAADDRARAAASLVQPALIGLQRQTEDKRTDPAALHAIYEQNVGEYTEPDAWKTLDDDSLSALYQATQSLTFYTHDPDAARLLAELSTELLERDVTVPLMGRDHSQLTYNHLLGARLFDEAESFAEKHDEVVTPQSFELDRERLAQKRSEDGKVVMEINEADEVALLEPRNIQIDDGQWLIVTSHPGCGFSREAMEYIDNNESLAAALPERSLWLAEQGALDNAQWLAEWNRGTPVTNLAVVDRNHDWPLEIELGRTPVFYFLDNGEIVHKAYGWRDSEQAEELHKGSELLARENSD